MLLEIDNLRRYGPHIQDVHFGGGTPSHLDRKQFTQLCDRLNTMTDLAYLREVAMEIDPRTVNNDDLQHYSNHGVNRISFGIQDFDPIVQKSINREQPPEMVSKLLESRNRFQGVNFDLLYGLPNQTLKTVENTLVHVVKMRPERITLLKYCHAPEVRRHMKLISEAALPPKSDLPKMFVNIAETLIGSGYRWIGLDHFCLPHDSLAKKVGRTFNGFSSGATEMIGLGPTTTSVFGSLYAQAHYDLKEYYASVKRGEFPILRGYEMTEDDLERRRIIFDLLCHQQATVPMRFGPELKSLQAMPELCEVTYRVDVVTGSEAHVRVTEYGRLLLRNVCKVFDNRDVERKHHKIAQLNMVRRASPAGQPA